MKYKPELMPTAVVLSLPVRGAWVEIGLIL